MNFESTLPPEAFKEMQGQFEGLQPVITESKLRELCDTDPVLNRLRENMTVYFDRYAVDVWSMHQFIDTGKFNTEDGAQVFAEMDDARTRLHTALVDSIAILSRALLKSGRDTSWIQELSTGTNLDRASCGAFALLLVYRRYLDTLIN